MTKEKARVRFKKLNAEIENLMNEWTDLGEELEYLIDSRKRFVKKHGKFLSKKAVAGVQGRR